MTRASSGRWVCILGVGGAARVLPWIRGEHGSERSSGDGRLTDSESWRGRGPSWRSLECGVQGQRALEPLRRKGSAGGAGPRVTRVLTCLAPVASRLPPVPAGPRNTPRPFEGPPLRQAPPPPLTGIPRPPRSLIWRHSAAARLPPPVCPAGRARARDRPRRPAHHRA